MAELPSNQLGALGRVFPRHVLSGDRLAATFVQVYRDRIVQPLKAVFPRIVALGAALMLTLDLVLSRERLPKPTPAVLSPTATRSMVKAWN